MNNQEKRQPPVWLLIIIFFTIFLLIPLGITYLFDLPLFLYPFPQYWGIIAGLIVLSIGLGLIIDAFKNLKLKRAFGKEIYQSKNKSTLITTGIYAYVRNPLYLGSIITFIGWFLITLLLILLAMTFEFCILFILVGKWEEKELTKRFGDEYIKYKKMVPFLIPIPNRRFRNEEKLNE